jgi:hypothetical protein
MTYNCCCEDAIGTTHGLPDAWPYCKQIKSIKEKAKKKKRRRRRTVSIM